MHVLSRVHPSHTPSSSPRSRASNHPMDKEVAQAEPSSNLAEDDHAEDSRMNPEHRLDEILTQLEHAFPCSRGHAGGHPMGTNIFSQMMNLFFGVFSGTGVGRIFAYVQESPELTTSGLGMDTMISYMALFYTFFGIYAADHSAAPTTIPENTSSLVLHTLSRSLYVFLTTHCLCGVVFCLHFMLVCGSMPLLRRRNYLIERGWLLFLPYSAGPLSFIFLGMAFFAERASEICRTNSKASLAEDIVFSITLVMSMILWLLGAYFGTVTIRDSMRPWPEALFQLATEVKEEVRKNKRASNCPNLKGALGLPTS